MEKRMLGDATARAMTGGIVLARGIGEIHDGKGVGRGTVVIVIATGETVTKMDGVREIGSGALAETDSTTNEVRVFFKLLTLPRFWFLGSFLMSCRIPSQG